MTPKTTYEAPHEAAPQAANGATHEATDEATYEMTYQEAHLVRMIALVLKQGRLNPKAPTFTARGLGDAITGITGRRTNEREIGPLLDHIGAFLNVRSRRATQALMAGLPAWCEAADKLINAHTQRESDPRATITSYTLVANSIELSKLSYCWRP